MQVVILVVHLFIAMAMIGMILLQRSEGGALGIGGGGTAGGLFSARGAANALTRTTAFLAAAFFATSILLTVLANVNHQGASVLAPKPASQPTTPATPSPYDPVNGSPANPATAPGGEPSGAPGDQPAAPPASGPVVPTPTQPSAAPGTPPATPPADKPNTP